MCVQERLGVFVLLLSVIDVFDLHLLSIVGRVLHLPVICCATACRTPVHC
jgi:hypothetical protein